MKSCQICYKSPNLATLVVNHWATLKKELKTKTGNDFWSGHFSQKAFTTSWLVVDRDLQGTWIKCRSCFPMRALLRSCISSNDESRAFYWKKNKEAWLSRIYTSIFSSDFSSAFQQRKRKVNANFLMWSHLWDSFLTNLYGLYVFIGFGMIYFTWIPCPL